MTLQEQYLPHIFDDEYVSFGCAKDEIELIDIESQEMSDDYYIGETVTIRGGDVGHITQFNADGSFEVVCVDDGEYNHYNVNWDELEHAEPTDVLSETV